MVIVKESHCANKKVHLMHRIQGQCSDGVCHIRIGV